MNTDFYQNLNNGIAYYRCLPGVASTRKESFIKALDFAEVELDYLNYQYAIQGECCSS